MEQGFHHDHTEGLGGVDMQQGWPRALLLPPTNRAHGECLDSLTWSCLCCGPHLDTPAGLHMQPTGLMTPEGWA